MIKIAVIIINYKGISDTLQCLDSIKEIKGKNKIKLIIIDNFSNDGSVPTLKRYVEKNRALDIELIVSNENKGFSGGNNLGIRKAIEEQIPYIMLLNNDTIIKEDIFQASLDFFRQHKDCSIIAVCLVRPDGRREEYTTRRKPSFFNLLFLYHSPFWNKTWFPGYKKHYFLEKDFDTPFQVYTGSGACMVFKSVFFKATGLMDENIFLFAEEFIIGEMAKENNFNAYFMPVPSVIHLGAQTTKTVKAFSFIEYCKSENHLMRKYYNYGRMKLSLFFLYRSLNYLYKSITKIEYRENLKRFFKIYLKSNLKETFKVIR